MVKIDVIFEDNQSSLVGYFNWDLYNHMKKDVFVKYNKMYLKICNIFLPKFDNIWISLT